MSILKVRDENGQIVEIPAIRGEKGADGHTPQKGVDYWTEADKVEALTSTDLTEEQKAQARDNIGAADANVIGSIETALDSIIAIQNNLIGGDGA